MSEHKWYLIKKHSSRFNPKTVISTHNLPNEDQMQMNLLEQFLTALKSGDPYAIAAVTLVSIVISLKWVLGLIETRQSLRNELLENGLKQDFLTQTVRLAIQENRNSYYFELATRIKANKQLREQLNDIIEKSGGEIMWVQLAKSKRFLKLSDKKLNIEVKRSDQLTAAFNAFCALFLGFLAYILLIAATTPSAITMLQKLSITSTAVVLLIFATYLISQAMVVWDAQKLSKFIVKLESKEAERNSQIEDSVNLSSTKDESTN
jgi:hypothetical protein